MSNLCCIHTSPTTPPRNSFHSAPREILAITAEGTRVLFSRCFCNLPPTPPPALRRPQHSGPLCSPDRCSAHTVSHPYTTAHRTDLNFQVALDTRCQQHTLHVGRGAQGRAPVWVPLPGPQHLPDSSVLPTETASHRPRVSAGEPERGDRHGTKGTQLGKGDTQETERSRCRK